MRALARRSSWGLISGTRLTSTPTASASPSWEVPRGRPQPARQGHARNQIRNPPLRRGQAFLRRQREPLARGARRLAKAARRRAHRSLLRASPRPFDPRRRHCRRTREVRRQGPHRLDRAIGGRARHAAPRPRRAPDRGGAIGIFAVDAQPGAWACPGLRRDGRAPGRFSPLGRGFLSGLLQDVETFGEKDFRHANPRFHGAAWRRNRARLEAFLALARKRRVAPATLAIAWALAKAPNIVPISGTRTGGASRRMRCWGGT